MHKGTGPAVTDLLGGRIDADVLALDHGCRRFVEGAGKLKAIATTGAKRSEFHPPFPRWPRAGCRYEVDRLVPAGAGAKIRHRRSSPSSNRAVVAIMAEDVIEHMAKLGAEPGAGARRIRPLHQRRHWQEVVEAVRTEFAHDPRRGK